MLLPHDDIEEIEFGRPDGNMAASTKTFDLIVRTRAPGSQARTLTHLPARAVLVCVLAHISCQARLHGVSCIERRMSSIMICKQTAQAFELRCCRRPQTLQQLLYVFCP